MLGIYYTFFDMSLSEEKPTSNCPTKDPPEVDMWLVWPTRHGWRKEGDD